MTPTCLKFKHINMKFEKKKKKIIKKDRFPNRINPNRINESAIFRRLFCCHGGWQKSNRCVI